MKKDLLLIAALTIVALVSLVSCGKKKDSPSIYSAAMLGDIKQVKAMLQHDPQLAFSKDTNGGGWTALHIAVIGDQTDIVKLLLASKADINATNNVGTTPLHSAALNGYKDMVELLLANGANVNAKDDMGETPLHYAVKHDDVAELLRQHGGHE